MNINIPSEQLSNLELFAQLEVEGFITGLHRSPFHGFSVEFSEHRLYNAGDNIKHIDWKLFAKSEKLFSKRYVEETNLRCQFVLDVSSSMYLPKNATSKIEFSIKSIAALIFLLKRQRDAFGLSVFSEHLTLNMPAKSTTAHQKFIFNKLQELLNTKSLNQKTDISSALHQIADQIHKRSLVIIFSDMLQTGEASGNLHQLFDALQHLKFNKHEVIVFNVADKKMEIDFDFENRPYTFVDIESGEELKVKSIDVRAHFQNFMRNYRKEISLKCAQYKIDLIDANIDQGYKYLLEQYLIKRQKYH